MIGPLLGGMAFQWLGMKGAYTLTALVQFLGAFAMAGLVHAQITRKLDLARIPAEIAEGLAFARTKPTILLVFGITIVTNTFAFAYSGLVAPLGLSAFHVSPALVGLLAAGEPLGALLGGALIAAGAFAPGPTPRLRRRRGAVHDGPDRDGAFALLLAGLRRAGGGRLRHGRLQQHADRP